MNTPQHQNTRNEESIETNLVSPPDDRNSLIKEQKDVLLGMYCESCTHARHYEAQRATISSIIILGTVGMIGFIGHLDHDDWPLVVSIMLLGFFGSMFTRTYSKLTSFHHERAKKYSNALDALLSGPTETTEKSKWPAGLFALAESTHEAKFKSWKPRMSHLLPMFWPLLIPIIALPFLIYALHPNEESKPPQVTISWEKGAAVTVSGAKKP
jgi:hypothetical protein